MEDNQQSSMTDRDRKMRESFETFDEPVEKREKRSKMGLPKRSLFFGESKPSEVPKPIEKPSTAEWLIKQNSRAEWRQGLLRNLMVENTEAARRAQEEATSVADPEKELNDEHGVVKEGGAPIETSASKEAEGAKPRQRVEADTQSEAESDKEEKKDAEVKTVPDASSAQKTTEKPPRREETKKVEASEKHTQDKEPKVPPAPNIIAAATLNTDPELAKMNDYFYRRKKTGTLLLTGLVGYASSRSSQSRAAESLSSRQDNNTEKGAAGEAAQERPTHDRKTAPEAVEAKSSAVDVRTMTMPELLQLAEHIDAGVGSLKDMYLQGRIDAVNLRKIVAEHAAGRNIEMLLKRSLQAEEMKHELRNEIKTANTQTPTITKPTVVSTKKHTVQTEKLSKPEQKTEPEQLQKPTSNAVEPAVTTTDLAPAPEHEPPIYVSSTTDDALQADFQEPQYASNESSEPSVEYIRVPTYLAILIGVSTGGILAAVLLIFIF